jgi:hypothetical protein
MKRRVNGIAAYEYWVLRALSDNGGSAKVPYVYEVVGEKLRHQFGPHELETVKTDGSNQPVWKNETRQARRNMVRARDGRMHPKEDYGMWTISPKGAAWLKDNPDPPSLNSRFPDDEDLGGDI